MDPYLEDPAFWPDFHHTFIGCWREAVADLLPDHYEARVEERIHLVQMSPEVIKLIYPDVAVTQRSQGARKPSKKTGTLLLEPVTIPNEFLEEVREYRIEILNRPLPPADYYAFISRTDNRPNCEVYSWTVRQPLPAIPIPLKNPDPDVIIDLERVFRQTYERGRYARSLRYGSEPLAPLSKKDKAWARQQVGKKKNQRPA
jgi:hypothetical protein